MEVSTQTVDTSREAALLAHIDTLTHTIAEKTEALRRADRTIEILQQMLFGPSTERVKSDDSKQGRLFNEAETEADAQPGEPSKETPREPAKRTKKQGSGRRRPSGDLERVEIIHDLDPEACACPWCAAPRPKIGEERTEEYEMIPAKVIVNVHVRAKYGPCPCDDFIGHEETAIITAPGPARIVPGSLFSNTTAAFILVSKFADGIPFHRQESVLSRMGLPMTRGTMARLAIRIGEELEPILTQMQTDLRLSPVLGMDETVVQVLHEPDQAVTSQSRMWVARGFGGGERTGPILWFEYADSRAGLVAERIVGDYTGYLQSDGYGGYTALGKREGIVHVGCWAHIRREFHSLYHSDDQSPLARQALHLIGELYVIERGLREQLELKLLDPASFTVQRKEATTPVFVRILEWLREQSEAVPPRDPLGKAISYALGQYRRAIRYVDHWLLTPDNNPVENSIRPFVIGRKNWLFNDTPRGATASARFYSLIETAKANGHEPFKYLRHLFKTLPAQTDRTASAATLVPYTLEPNSY